MRRHSHRTEETISSIDDSGKTRRVGRKQWAFVIAAATACACVIIWQSFAVEEVEWSELGPSHKGHVNEFGLCEWRDPRALLVLRTPKAASTTMTNALSLTAARTRRFRVQHLPEWPQAVGPIPGQRFPRRDPDAKRAARFGATLSEMLDRAAEGKHRVALAGHVFVVENEKTAILGLARDPLQRLASGFYYVRRDRRGTVGACAANESCARVNDLGRLCSLHALYFCGYHPACGLDANRVATDATVDRAIQNINSSTILLVVPASRLDEDGLASLSRLLPAYFERRRSRPPDRAYDRDGERRSPKNHPRKDATGKWNVAANDHEAAALDALCRQDRRVVDFAARLYDEKIKVCERRPD